MKTFEKKVMRFVFSNRLKTDMLFVGTIQGLDFFGNSYFFGRIADNFFDKEKFKKVALDKIVKYWMINPENNKLIKPRFTITKEKDKLVLVNFQISYDGDRAISESTCNYDYYKLFEKDTCYILDTKDMICLYDENKSLIGFICKAINH